MPKHETTGEVVAPEPQVPQTPEQTDEPPILQWSVVEDLRSQIVHRTSCKWKTRGWSTPATLWTQRAGSATSTTTRSGQPRSGNE